MNILIVGYGFVGQALSSVIHQKNTVFICDPAHTLHHTPFNEAIKRNIDAVFLCLPTPTVEGRCDDSLILEYTEKLKHFPGLVVVKSTCPISTVDNVLEMRPSTVFWPELLREAHADYDIKNPTMIVVGAPSDLQFQYVVKFITDETEIFHDNKSVIFKTSPKNAVNFKYAVNSFLATKVVFFHQMYKWMEQRGDVEQYDELVALLGHEPRIGDSHLKAPGTHGLGFAGSCFPKDTEALLHQVGEDGSSFELLEAVIEQNKLLQNQVK